VTVMVGWFVIGISMEIHLDSSTTEVVLPIKYLLSELLFLFVIKFQWFKKLCWYKGSDPFFTVTVPGTVQKDCSYAIKQLQAMYKVIW